MRQLYFIPVIHAQADLGCQGQALTKRRRQLLGTGRNDAHERVVKSVWSRIWEFFKSMDVQGMKIYQDGLAKGGKLGERIVSDLASKGSDNFKVLCFLTDRGARLMATEDLGLLQQEHALITNLVGAKHLFSAAIHYGVFKLKNKRILKKRDQFIAAQINRTLAQGENGALFLGAMHNATVFLPPDIRVTSLVNPDLIKAYMKSLAGRNNDDAFWALSRELTEKGGPTPEP